MAIGDLFRVIDVRCQLDRGIAGEGRLFCFDGKFFAIKTSPDRSDRLTNDVELRTVNVLFGIASKVDFRPGKERVGLSRTPFLAAIHNTMKTVTSLVI